MRALVTENGAPGRAERGERQGVRRRSRRDEKNGQVRLENLAQEVRGRGAKGIGAIGRRRAGVGCDDGLEDGLADARRIVAVEIHGLANREGGVATGADYRRHAA
jgi:hypothetical protein